MTDVRAAQLPRSSPNSWSTVPERHADGATGQDLRRRIALYDAFHTVACREHDVFVARSEADELTEEHIQARHDDREARAEEEARAAVSASTRAMVDRLLRAEREAAMQRHLEM